MRKSALNSAILLLPIVVLLAVLACDDSQNAPAPVPAAKPSVDGEQTRLQSESVTPPTPKPPVATGPPQRSPVPPQVFPIPMQVTYVTAKNLDNAPDGSSDALAKLVAHSTLIVIGTTADAEPREERIPGRLSSDPSKPDPNYATIANVYDVQVERYLKGEGGEGLSLSQSIGFDAFVPGPPNTPGRLTKGRNDSLGVRLGRNSRYLLFLEENDHPPGLWKGIAEPYRFLLAEDEARVESPVGTLEGIFRIVLSPR